MHRPWCLILAALVTMYCQQGSAEQGKVTKPLATVERVISFVVQQEIQASHLEKRRDVCLRFGHGLEVNEKAILAELAHRGFRLRPGKWCNDGPRGLVIDVIAPINKKEQHTYEVVVQLGDFSPMEQGEDLAVLLRRGTYTIGCPSDSDPQLVSYEQACCGGSSPDK